MSNWKDESDYESQNDEVDCENLYEGIKLRKHTKIDVLDREGVWNSGRVENRTFDKILVKYTGWGVEYNEWIQITSDRIAPLHFYTIPVKCWAKLEKWPWWPAITILRLPATAYGSDCLRHEQKLYIEFLDSKNANKRAKCWLDKKFVVAFREGFKQKSEKCLGKGFDYSVFLAREAKALNMDLSFVDGTLPSKYESSFTPSISEKTRNMGSSIWANLFLKNCDRYDEIYAVGIEALKAAKSKKSKKKQIKHEEVCSPQKREYPTRRTKVSPPSNKKRRLRERRSSVKIETKTYDDDESSDFAAPNESTIGKRKSLRSLTKPPKSMNDVNSNDSEDHEDDQENNQPTVANSETKGEIVGSYRAYYENFVSQMQNAANDLKNLEALQVRIDEVYEKTKRDIAQRYRKAEVNLLRLRSNAKSP